MHRLTDLEYWNNGYSSRQITDSMPNGLPWPRISIITPSYNQGPFIEETIRSVLLQSYPNLEYIIMDGGSTDNTVQIIKKYESRISYWVSEKDRGQAHAVNKGWAMTNGEILSWLNSDDFYLPGALHQVAAAYGEGGRGLIYGDCQVADENGNIRPGKKCMANYSLVRLLTEYNMPQPAVFMTRDLVNDMGMLDEKMIYAMDYDFFLRAWTSKKEKLFRYIPQVVAVSREHKLTKCAGSLLKGRSAFLYENIYVLNRWWENVEKTQSGRAMLAHAFGLALYRQAGFLIATRDLYAAARVIAKAVGIAPIPVFRKAYRNLSRKIRATLIEDSSSINE